MVPAGIYALTVDLHTQIVFFIELFNAMILAIFHYRFFYRYVMPRYSFRSHVFSCPKSGYWPITTLDGTLLSSNQRCDWHLEDSASLTHLYDLLAIIVCRHCRLFFALALAN